MTSDEIKGPWTPNWVCCPGETLQETLEYSQVPLAVFHAPGDHEIDEGTLQGLLDGVEPVTAELADRLAHHTGVSAMFWLNMEHNYRAGLAAGLSHPHEEL